MITFALTVHILGAVASFGALGMLIHGATKGDRDASRRNLSLLAMLVVFDGASGALLAILSHTPAMVACENIAYYVLVFTAGVVFTSWRLAKHGAMIPVTKPLILGGVGPFAPILVASLLGL